MNTRTYGQVCGLARALELIGERWSLLVVRDLMLGPKRFTDLMRGLPKMPASILSARLNELESTGVVQRRVLAELDASVVYELTEYGAELDQILLQLGLWGARSLAPNAHDLFTMDSAILSMYATFRPEAALDVHATYELRFGEDMVVHLLIEDGALKAAEGSYPDADAVIRPTGMVMLDLLTGQLSPAEALATQQVEIEGPAEYLELFTQLFHIPAAPVPTEGLVVH
ncbi:MAG TPA: winged helix-turn-helix transcriptional regulator [Pseudonocardiaceae bacterium]|jgi:DNA-binding HxlR family transcriptional regulator|nr:winged helix-turn-helix transcriptional regulator [Pseudonocardiaceae bacterium]